MTGTIQRGKTNRADLGLWDGGTKTITRPDATSGTVTELTIGEEILQAYYRMETLEMYCRIRLVTKILGGAKNLDERQVEDLYRIKEKQGWDRPGSADGDLPIDQKTVDVITQVVLEVLREKGMTS